MPKPTATSMTERHSRRQSNPILLTRKQQRCAARKVRSSYSDDTNVAYTDEIFADGGLSSKSSPVFIKHNHRAVTL